MTAETRARDTMTLGALRDDLYRIPNVANAFNVIGVWLQTAGVLVLACWVNNPIMWVAAFLLMGRGCVLFAILAHEAAHRLLFSNKRLNDFVGRWIVGAPGFVPLDAYRGYPITKASWHRKLRRDAIGVSGYKNVKPLFLALKSATARPVALRIWVVQIGLFLAGGLLLERWWLWPVMPPRIDG